MKPSLPQGTRDFNAEVIYRRRFILDTITDVFELYGFEPLETPAMENLETLLGKYGEEGDKLIFRILNNGLDHPGRRAEAVTAFGNILAGRNEPLITERALRYDLTIPFARYVSMNLSRLTLPFKRYQIQPVWRADRPQKGRYREFYQCDADVAGTTSLISDAEFALIYLQVFERLKVEIEVKINSRRILSALAEACGASEHFTAITVAIDKLDKIGLEKVKEELAAGGLQPEQISLIQACLTLSGNNEERLSKASLLLGNTASGLQGISELTTILEYIATARKDRPADIYVDFTLARGLNYYTGTIFEVKAKNIVMGSIGGGGRYDDLTGLFDLPGIPGVGISFGVDRIYDVMNELNLFPQTVDAAPKVLFFNLGVLESKAAFTAMQELRSGGTACELFYEHVRMDRQFKYANKKRMAYAVIIGSRELEQGTCVVKDLLHEKQVSMPLTDLSSYFSR